MKNRRCIFIIIIAVSLMIFVPQNVSARTLCLHDQMSELENQALKTKVSYKLVRGPMSAYYEVVVTNLDPKFIIKYNNISYNGDNYGMLTIPNRFEPDTQATFEIYTRSDLAQCKNAKLTSKKVKFPFYNVYSERQECIEYEEFPLCNVNYKGEIKNANDFETRLRKWIEETKSDIEEYKDNRNIIQIIVDWYSDNLQLAVTLTLIIGLLLIAFIIRMIVRKIKRTKVKI